MKKITKEELEVFLRKHKLWLANDPAGERANLQGANLRDANLWDANLQGADLRGANLRGANLRGANLQGANLRDANLWDANLQGADLRGANLRGANLQGANLRDANLRDAKNVSCPIACPEEGSFVAFKKARNDIIVKLLIPEDAKRCSATSRKCRCNKAIALEFTNLDGSACDLTEIPSDYDKNFVYKVGEMVSVDNFDDDRWHECAPGIHFFITRQEAIDY